MIGLYDSVAWAWGKIRDKANYRAGYKVRVESKIQGSLKGSLVYEVSGYRIR